MAEPETYVFEYVLDGMLYRQKLLASDERQARRHLEALRSATFIGALAIESSACGARQSGETPSPV